MAGGGDAAAVVGETAAAAAKAANIAEAHQREVRASDPEKMRTISVPSGGVRGRGSRALRVIIEHRRVLDQDTVADPFVGGPDEEEIEKDGVVGFLLAFARMRPVAAPYAAFGRRLGVCLRD